MADAPKVQVQRSLLGRARGLGTAKSGTGHWWVQRVTALALVPLAVWFVLAVIAHLGASQAEVAAWLGQPISAALMLCLIVALFQHMQLGLQAVLEDYIHDEAMRVVALLVMKGVTVFLALACIVSVLRLALFRVA
jgi:succinate dehydrogenase / fumarate reductase, membrane anchor subunit